MKLSKSFRGGPDCGNSSKYPTKDYRQKHEQSCIVVNANIFRTQIVSCIDNDQA